MESVDKKVVTTTNHRWFTFTQEEAAALRKALMNDVNWEKFDSGQHYDFFLGLYESLADVEYPS